MRTREQGTINYLLNQSIPWWARVAFLLVQNRAWDGSSKLESFSKLNIGKGLFLQRMGHVLCVSTDHFPAWCCLKTENAHLQADLPSKCWADFNDRFMKSFPPNTQPLSPPSSKGRVVGLLLVCKRHPRPCTPSPLWSTLSRVPRPRTLALSGSQWHRQPQTAP